MRGWRHRPLQHERSAAGYPSSANAKRRALSSIFNADLSSWISFATGAPSRISLSMGFSMVAIDETFMDYCGGFETSSKKRGNYATARFSNTRAGNLTVFIAPRLPCFT
jgi:hypothetical protein